MRAGPKGPDGRNQSGEGPLHAGSDQKALLQGEDEPRRRRQHDLYEGRRFELPEGWKGIGKLSIECRKLEEFDGNGQSLATIGDTGILGLAAGAGIADGSFLIERNAARTAGWCFVLRGGGLRKATTERVRDENREEKSREMTD